MRVIERGAKGIARVSVSDEGPGLTPEQQQQVWKRFYQAGTPRHYGPDGGLGLGLAIAKAIVEQHEGQIRSREHSWPGFDLLVCLARGRK